MRPQRPLIARPLPTAVAGGIVAAALAWSALLAPAPAATAGTAAAARPVAVSRPLTAAAGAPAGVSAAGADLVNAATGRRLWSRGLNTERPIASITKVMTALVVIRAGDLSRKIRISQAVVNYVREHDGSSAGLRRRGHPHRASAAGGHAPALRQRRRLRPGRRLRARLARLRQEDERHRPGAGHAAHPLRQLRRAAVADRVHHLFHAQGPDHPGPGGHAAGHLPGHRATSARTSWPPRRSTTPISGRTRTSCSARTPAPSASRPGSPTAPGTACCSRRNGTAGP